MEAVIRDASLMTTLLERFTSTDGGTMQVPEGTPHRNTTGLWKGVPGLDHTAHVADPEAAARITAMRCALWVFGPEAASKPIAGIGGQPIVAKWLTWLLAAGVDVTEAWIRRNALRDACEWVIANGMTSWS